MKRSLHGLLAILAASARCSGCGDDGAVARVPLGLEVAPRSVTFDATALGFTRTATIAVTNTGGAPLEGLSLRTIGAGFDVVPPPRAQIAAGETLLALVTFTPRSEGPHEGVALVDAGGIATASVALHAAAIPRPECDDDNPCTTDTPHPDGTCAHGALEGPCDDRNACTQDEVCVGARCVGEAVTCTPPASCFGGLCGTERGCVFVPEPSACDDGDPCTIDLCTEGGCTHSTAADGTPCGPFAQCVEVHVCVLGGCVEAAVPEGTPCSDGDLCTEGDRCAANRCAGAPIVRPAELIAFAPTFGGAGSVGAILRDGRAVIFDPLEDGRGAIATVLARTSTGVARIHHELRADLTGLTRGAVVATSTAPELAVLDDAGVLTIFDVDPAGALVRRGSTPAVGQAGSGRAKLVTLGRIWYACALGSPRLVTIDASDPDAPRVIGNLSLASGCSALAVDAERAYLFASAYDGGTPGSPGGLYRLSLAVPRAPAPMLHGLGGGGIRVATNGAIVATGDAGPFGRTSTITLRDPVTLDVRGRFDSGGGFFSNEIGDLVFAGDRLFVQSKSVLSAWDVEDPARPRRLFAVDRSGVGSGSNTPPPGALATDGRTLFRAGDGVYGGVPFIFDVETNLPRDLDHPARGGVQRLERHGGVLYGLDRTSVHALETRDPDRPRFLSGASVPVAAAATLWSLGAAAAPPRLFTSAQRPGVYTSSYRAVWQDGSDPSAPLALTRDFAPFSGGIVHADDDGHRALALAVTFAGDRARLLSWDLDGLTPATAETAFTSPASLELSTGPLDEQYGTIAFDGARALAVVIDPIANLFDPRERITSHLFVAALPAMTVEARATIEGHVVSAAVHGDRVILVLKLTGSLCCGPFLGEVVRTYAVRGGALALEGEAPLPSSWRVLDATASSAVVATRTGAAFLALHPEGPRVKGDIPLPEPPEAAHVVGERVWLAGPHGISAVRPPCP